MDRTPEFLKATVATEARYIELASCHDRLVDRVAALEETVKLLSQVIDMLVSDQA